MTGARIIDGKALAERIKRETAATVRALAEKGVGVSLDCRVGREPGGGRNLRPFARVGAHPIALGISAFKSPVSAIPPLAQSGVR